MAHISPLLLPIRSYEYVESIAAAESVSWSVSATVTASGALAGAESIDFSQSGTVTSGSAIVGAESIAFSESATVLATGQLQGSTSAAVTASSSNIGAPFSMSPLALSIKRYGFLPDGLVQASPAVAFSVTATATATGRVAAAAAVAFSEAASLTYGGTSSIASAESLDFTVSAPLRADGQLQAATSIAFSESVTADSGTSDAATAIALSATGTIAAAGRLRANTVVDFNTSVSLSLVEDPSASFNVSPLALPIRRYTFAASSPSQFGSTSIAFSAAGNVQATGGLGGDRIRASTSIADVFDTYVWLEGKGALAAAGSIAFSVSAELNYGALSAAGSVGFSVSATATADGQLQASTSIAFAESAVIDLVADAVAAESIAFSDSATLTAEGKLAGRATVRFLNAGQLITDIFGSTSIGFTASATPSGGDFTKRAGQFWVVVLPESEFGVTVAPLSDTITVAYDPFTYIVKADGWLVEIQDEDTREAA